MRQILLQKRILKEECDARDANRDPLTREMLREADERQQSLPSDERQVLSYEQLRMTYFKIWERSGCLTLATKDDGRLATMVTSYIPGKAVVTGLSFCIMRMDIKKFIIPARRIESKLQSWHMPIRWH